MKILITEDHVGDVILFIMIGCIAFGIHNYHQGQYKAAAGFLFVPGIIAIVAALLVRIAKTLSPRRKK